MPTPLDGLTGGFAFGAWLILFAVGMLAPAAVVIGLGYLVREASRAWRRYYSGLVVVLACLALSGCEPCHRQHRKVTFVPAHYATSMGMPCVPYLSDGCNYYRDACVPSTVCDEQCRALDAGRSEAHEKHPPLIGAADIDARCQ